MHIESPAAIRRADIYCGKIGREICGDLGKPSTAVDALQALDSAGITRGMLLSTAYLAGSPELSEGPDQLARETRAENIYVVDQARIAPDRLRAFISVNPIAGNAIDEINYWGHQGGATGIKLHLANSHFDFESPKQVKVLAEIFCAAAANRLPIIIHMRNWKADYGSKEVEIFLRDVLPSARGITVQIAHSGGWGGADSQALSALGAFAEAIRRDPNGTSNLYFDMAMMPDMPKQAASPEDLSRYVALIRTIGLKRFLLASDWVMGTDLKAYYTSIQQRLNLKPAEWHVIAWNIAPYWRSDRP